MLLASNHIFNVCGMKKGGGGVVYPYIHSGILFILFISFLFFFFLSFFLSLSLSLFLSFISFSFFYFLN